jgi:hypothetical protein
LLRDQPFGPTIGKLLRVAMSRASGNSPERRTNQP